jgi:hypothetical protein
MHAPPASRSPKNVINYFHFFTDLPVDRSFQQRYWALRLWTGYQGVGQLVTDDPSIGKAGAVAGSVLAAPEPGALGRRSLPHRHRR